MGLTDGDWDGLAYLVEKLSQLCREKSEEWFSELYANNPEGLPEHLLPFYMASAAAGEAGELVNKVKKAVRKPKILDTDDFRLDWASEASDVLVYLLLFTDEIGISIIHTLRRVMEINERRFGEGATEPNWP